MSAALNSAAQKLLDAFANSSGGKTGSDYLALYNAITSSSPLAAWFNSAAANGSTKSGVYLTAVTYDARLTSIANFDPTVHAITISQGYLNSVLLGTAGPTDPLAQERLQFTIGHETGHADDAAGVNGSRSSWQTNVLSPYVAHLSTNNDATNVVVSYEALTLKDEGYANIQGWNDVVAYVNATGRSLTQAESEVGQYLFKGPGSPQAGLTVSANGTIALTSQNETAAGQVLLNIHPSIATPDLLTTYAQLYAADAIDQIIAKAHPVTITLKYSSAHLDVEAVTNMSIGAAQTDVRLIESGLTVTSSAFNIKDSSSGGLTVPTLNRFQLDQGLKAASVFYGNDGYATQHVVVGSNNDVKEVDVFDSANGNVITRDFYSRDGSGRLVDTSADFDGAKPYSASVTHFDALYNILAMDQFDTSSGKLIDHTQYSGQSYVETGFNADGSTTVWVYDDKTQYFSEIASFKPKGIHAYDIDVIAADGSDNHQTFDTQGRLASVALHNGDGSIKQSESFANGVLNDVLIVNPSSGVRSDHWGYDFDTGALNSFVEDGPHAVNWHKNSNGTWTEGISGKTQGTAPNVPSPHLIGMLNADSLLSHDGWITSTAYHSIAGFHI